MTRSMEELDNYRSEVLELLANIDTTLSPDEIQDRLNEGISQYYDGQPGNYVYQARVVVKDALGPNTPWVEVMRLDSASLCAKAREAINISLVPEQNNPPPTPTKTKAPASDKAPTKKKSPATAKEENVVNLPPPESAPVEAIEVKMAPTPKPKEPAKTPATNQVPLSPPLSIPARSYSDGSIESRLTALEESVAKIRRQSDEIVDLLKESYDLHSNDLNEALDNVTEISSAVASEYSLEHADMGMSDTVNRNMFVLFNRLWGEIRMSMLSADYRPPLRLVSVEEMRHGELANHEDFYAPPPGLAVEEIKRNIQHVSLSPQEVQGLTPEKQPVTNEPPKKKAPVIKENDADAALAASIAPKKKPTKKGRKKKNEAVVVEEAGPTDEDSKEALEALAGSDTPDFNPDADIEQGEF